MRRILTLCLALGLVVGPAFRAAAHSGNHSTFEATNSQYRGVMRQLEVTNPSVKNNSDGYFTAALYMIGTRWTSIGWGEFGFVGTNQYLYVRDKFAPDSYVRIAPLTPGTTISMRIIPFDDLCPDIDGRCHADLQILVGGVWDSIALGQVDDDGTATQHSVYEYQGPSNDNLNHGELAQAAAGGNVNTYDAKLRSLTFGGYVWNSWGSTVSTTEGNTNPYYTGFSTKYTDYYGYCSGTC